MAIFLGNVRNFDLSSVSVTHAGAIQACFKVLAASEPVPLSLEDVRGASDMKTCLVVDDSGLVRKIARRILERLGFLVEEAVDGQDALDCCAKAMPDVILLDWEMPVISGIEFLRLLRAREDGAAPKVIFCTSLNDMEHIAEALGAGADEYIMKPFDDDILHEKLEAVGMVEKDLL